MPVRGRFGIATPYPVPVSLLDPDKSAGGRHARAPPRRPYPPVACPMRLVRGGVSSTKVVAKYRSSPTHAVTTSTLSPSGALWRHALRISSSSGRLPKHHAPPSRLAPPQASSGTNGRVVGAPPTASLSSLSPVPRAARRLRESRIARAPRCSWCAPCPPENRRALTYCAALTLECPRPRARSRQTN